MDNKKVLLIDDEIYGWYMEFYVDELQKNNFEVTKCPSVDEAKLYLEGNLKFEVIIIDVLMPPGEWLKNEDTQDGLMTGKFLALKAKILQPQAKLVILTNMQDSERAKVLEEITQVLQKVDYKPEKLAEKIVEISKV